MILIRVNVLLSLKGNPLPVVSAFDAEVAEVHVFFSSLLRKYTVVPELPVQPHLELGVRCHPPSSSLLVLELGAAVPSFPDCPGGTVGYSHTRIRGILMLAARTAGRECFKVAVGHCHGEERFTILVFLHAEDG
jgi:hypothetical protein